MKSVLISVQPKHCELIAQGNETVLVRKTRPKLEAPFKCYIYETKSKHNSIYERYKVQDLHCGKVIGEFVCDCIECVNAKCSDMGIDLFYHDCQEYGCLSQVEVEKYFGVYNEERTKDLREMKGNGYAWHIADLKIYDRPKELSEFCKHDNSYDNMFGWLFEDREKGISLTRPPQSWCYVEEQVV